MSVDGTAVLDVPVTLPPSAYVGFTAANGGSTDTHLVRTVSIATSPSVVANQLPALSDSTWHANGVASVANGVATLTPASTLAVAGDLINSTAVSPLGLQATFTESISGTGTTGADGLSIAFLDASSATTTSLGSTGAGVGLAGVPAVAVTLQTYPALGLALLELRGSRDVDEWQPCPDRRGFIHLDSSAAWDFPRRWRDDHEQQSNRSVDRWHDRSDGKRDAAAARPSGVHRWHRRVHRPAQRQRRHSHLHELRLG